MTIVRTTTILFPCVDAHPISQGIIGNDEGNVDPDFIDYLFQDGNNYQFQNSNNYIFKE